MASNLALLESAARKLGKLTGQVVFVGGATLDLLVTDEAAAPVRGTIDVDVIAEITTYADNAIFSERLRALGFANDTRDRAPLCRWIHGDLVLDVMPVEASEFGSSNVWYRGAMTAARRATLPSGAVIRLITAPFSLAPKWRLFEAEGATTSSQVTTSKTSLQ